MHVPHRTLQQAVRSVDVYKSPNDESNNNWYVITGPSSSGTSTTAAEISKAGFHWIEEAARLLIDAEIKRGKTIAAIRSDEQLFQEDVASLKGVIEATQDPSRHTFFVRGMHDSVAYARLNGFDLSASATALVQAAQYKKVFILDPLDTYTEDYARVEGAQKAAAILPMLHEAYAEAGMEPISIPVLPPSERAALILEHAGLS